MLKRWSAGRGNCFKMNSSWLPDSCQITATRHLAAFAGSSDYVPLGLSLRNAFSINRYEYLNDLDALFANEHAKAVAQAAIRSDLVPCLVVRHDPVVLPCLFGGEVANVGGRPMFEPFLQSIDSLWRLLPPSLESAVARRAFHAIEHFKAHAPAGTVVCKPPQLDPFDAALLMYGSDLLMDMVEEPKVIARFLDAITDAFVLLERRFKQLLGEPLRESVTYLGVVIPGVRVAADSMVNLSPDMIRRFCFPIFEHLAREFGGVLVHYCPSPSLKYYHVLETMAECPAVIGVDTSGSIDYLDDPANGARLDLRLTQVADCAIRPPDFTTATKDLHPNININQFAVREWDRLGQWIEGEFLATHRKQGRGVVLRATVDSIEEGRELHAFWQRLFSATPRRIAVRPCS